MLGRVVLGWWCIVTAALDAIRARLNAATPGPWEAGNYWHIQGAERCPCRPEWGDAVIQRMSINGRMMLAHRHRMIAPFDKHVIYTEPYKDGHPRSVVVTTDEYGAIAPEDAEFIANAPTDIAHLLAVVDTALTLHPATRVHEVRDGWGVMATSTLPGCPTCRTSGPCPTRVALTGGVS